ncbi:putative pectinesterase/pectinesterase inhibitor 22 [Andrographis paniculata]|uniref:putative pectinesterase/pectinesterase inhibitor 22 n=1 Tax=Andrographis paniculata TaxID=175694 RepID=UPI0021E8A961|nr:putative pectinesterase/pectinesterase inhibitor 22 [Andrographis paniculata]
MASTNSYLFISIIFFLSLTFLANANIHRNDQNSTIEAMILQACHKIKDQDTCLSNMHSRIGGDARRNPNSVLRAALHHAMNQTRASADALADFNTLSISRREQIAVDDCRELLDFSVSELGWSLGEMARIRAGRKTPRSDGHLRAWLSAAAGNQDTCLDGFEGTDRRLERFVRGSLSQVTQLISNVLTLYTEMHAMPFRPAAPPPENFTVEENDGVFPNWMTDGDKELLVGRDGDRRMQVDAVVAADGSGDYRTVAQAVAGAPSYSNRRYVIYVKEGVYHENVDMKKKKTNIMMIGDGAGKTVLSGDRNFLQGWTTFRTATLAVSGKGFIARDMTFRNTAGPENRQGVALRVDSDQSAFYRCSMEGYQDTLYAHSLRQFYRECSISGTIDFIFGNGAAVLQNCRIFTRQPLPLQKVTITAQGRKDPHQSTGFVVQDSFVYATRPTYLGRPWKQFSRTVFLNTYMTAMVQPRGWLEWNGDFALSTLWYGEYRNYGPGAAVAGRVRWPGYHVISDSATAGFFTVGKFLDGMTWLPATGVRFTAGLRT